MEALIIIMVLGIVSGGASVYHRRKQEKKDYQEYMAKRIAFSVSELNSKE